LLSFAKLQDSFFQCSDAGVAEGCGSGIEPVILPGQRRDTLAVAVRLPGIHVHNELSVLVAPATAATIRASNIIENWALAIIFCSAAIFFSLLIWSPFVSNLNIKTTLQIIGAAGLGSSFSQLYRATEYITTGTFDPKYNQVYLIRFALGIIAGLILGQFGLELFLKNDITGYDTLKGIGIATFGLLGGFSAEVVYQVLQRFADTLVTAVRGTGKERAEAEAERETTRKMAETASQIYDAINLPDAEREKKLKELAKNIVSPKRQIGG
jgi:hypothetical protein